MIRRQLLALLLALAAVSPVAAAESAPRNVILMVADGAGFAHVDLASQYATGRTGSQVYWRFPVRLAMSTYPAGGSYDPERAWTSRRWLGDRATDSAAAITAMTTGVKTDNGKLCVAPDGAVVPTLVELLERSGRATGVVTSVHLAHATPAGFVVSHPRRSEYAAISRKMLQDSAIDVVMGAGHPEHDNSGRATRADFRHVGGEATWRRILAGRPAADADRDGVGDAWHLVQDRSEFVALAGAGRPPRRVLGLPRVRETLQQKRDGDHRADPFVVPLNSGVPDLAEMSRAALNVLWRHGEGFGLLIEGGAVDWGGHDRVVGRTVEEQLDFDAAVAAVVAWLDARELWEQTLLVVTSDHECGHLRGVDGEGASPAVPPAAAGEMPAVEFRTGAHTHALVPLFARGAGSAALAAYADEHDPVRGAYLDNAELGAYLSELARSSDLARARSGR
jgi:alkaline phosphatase